MDLIYTFSVRGKILLLCTYSFYMEQNIFLYIGFFIWFYSFLQIVEDYKVKLCFTLSWPFSLTLIRNKILTIGEARKGEQSSSREALISV